MIYDQKIYFRSMLMLLIFFPSSFFISVISKRMIFERLITVSLNEKRIYELFEYAFFDRYSLVFLISTKFTNQSNNEYHTSSDGERTSSYSTILTLHEYTSKFFLRRYYPSENLIFFRVYWNWMTSTDLVSGNWDIHKHFGSISLSDNYYTRSESWMKWLTVYDWTYWGWIDTYQSENSWR